MEQTTVTQLKKHALNIRRGVIEGTFNAKSGHPGGSLSITDILTYLYFVEMNVDPANPRDEKRDRFVLSKGHCAPALYATLAEVSNITKHVITLEDPVERRMPGLCQVQMNTRAGMTFAAALRSVLPYMLPPGA